MKTDTIDQQPTVGVHASACFPDIFNAPNPADTALVPLNRADLAGTPVSGALAPRKPRNGKIARLPKPVRDVVNRMLFHHIPQEKIVAALDEVGIHVTQRNISNWKTRGGYREWCLAQEHALQLHLHQDNLLDLLRRHDASELPEIGLQAAATQLSQFFLTPEARQLLLSHPNEYERRVSMLSRISAQLKALQKYRDDCAKNANSKHDPERIRRETDSTLEKLTDDFSCTIPDSPKDPAMPHRNHLPNPRHLFHCAQEESPDKSPAPTFAEFVAMLRQPSAAAQLPHAAGPAPPASSPTSAAAADEST
jgi:hypothetical protein